jgi:hypothetical protein
MGQSAAASGVKFRLGPSGKKVASGLVWRFGTFDCVDDNLAHYRGFVNRSAIGVGIWRFVEGVNTEERSRTVVARVYPASDPATVARSYVLL